MTIFFPDFFGWNVLSSRFLIGIYYGIVATLPLAPSQLLSIRLLLLEDENQQDKIIRTSPVKAMFIAGVSGFLVAQFAMFLSIYYLPLYTAWFKPHIFNLILPPLLLWYFYRILEFDPVANLIPTYKHPLLDPRIRTTFLESFLFQIINPIVLPNPVFTRLMSIFLFRYSHIPTFVLGSLLGWVSGQFLFIFLSGILLSRLQLDSPSIYRIVKRVVHFIFPPIILAVSLSYIGRVGILPFMFKKGYIKDGVPIANIWPDILYNRQRPSRPMHFMVSSHQSKLRNQLNAPFNTLNIPYHKNYFSQYFFDVSISDGKRRLMHNYPNSVSLIKNELNQILQINKNSDTLFEEWVKQKEYRLIQFNQILKNKVVNLDRNIEDVIEKRLNSINEYKVKLYRFSKNIKKNVHYPADFSQFIRKYIKSRQILGNRIRKTYDNRLSVILGNNSTKNKNESPWFINQNKDKKISSLTTRNYLTRWKVTNNRFSRLKKIISKINGNNFYFDIYKNIPIWESRSKPSSFYFEFEFFKENLTRRRRRKSFLRSFVLGSTDGRSRNITGVFELLQTKPRSYFFLRAKEFVIDSRRSREENKLDLSQIESEKFDFANSHVIRGLALITQAFIRKYIKLPILILSKSLIRLLFMQSSDWNQDWAEWKQEEQVYCFYNGNYVSNNELPPFWLTDGLQIKILSPFHLKPWRPSSTTDLQISTVDQVIVRSSYLNIWGQETDVPFGQVQDTPFLKPIFKGLIYFCRYHLGKILRLCNKVYLYIYKLIFLIKESLFKDKDIFYKQNNKFNKIFNGKEKIPAIESHSSEKNTNILKKNLNKNQIENNQLENLKEESFKKKYIQEQNELLIQPIINNENQSVYQNKVSSLKEVIKLEPNLKYNKFVISPIDLILKKPGKFLKYQKFKMNMLVIKLTQKWLFLVKYTCRFIVSSLRFFKKKQFKVQQVIFKNLKKVTEFFIEQVHNIKIQSMTLIKFHTISLKYNSDSLNTITNYCDNKSNISLSQAYILHKIWQNNRFNRLPIYRILMDWKLNSVLRDNIKIVLNQQGLSNNQNPEDISIDSFKEWLKPFRRYTPSPEIWYKISPHIWRKVVQEFWINKNILLNNFEHYYQNNNNYSKAFSYYKPLFEKANKMNKRFRFHLLANSYTNSLKNKDIHDLLAGWQNQNREKIQLFRLKLINEKSTLKKYSLTSKVLLWGLTNTRVHSLAPCFSLKKSLNEIVSSKKMIYISEKRPIYYRYQNISFLEDSQFHNLKKRMSFRAILQYRIKSEKQRLKRFSSIDKMKKAKSDVKNAVQKAMVATKSQMKSAPIFVQQAKEATLRLKTISLSPLNCEIIKKRQAKILDDEIIMHSIIASFLRFKQRYLNNQTLGLLDPNFNQLIFSNQLLLNSSFLIPEEILLPKSIREFRILSCLKFRSQSKLLNLITNQTLDQFEQLNSNQIIKRYIWPTSRIEDLICMNRFWISTANQSRFNSLRIRIYPNLFQ
uniref:Protein TIC 214 n=1 Tax=Spirogyra maxima TaxID=3180 RepID=A0A191T4M0_SPIMX|nr:hypothetical chloroplast RF1 [Spirogyra maxima]ANI25332.1 hypothetical chloroplast RF1 [Spirogyra maxima]